MGELQLKTTRCALGLDGRWLRAVSHRFDIWSTGFVGTLALLSRPSRRFRGKIAPYTLHGGPASGETFLRGMGYDKSNKAHDSPAHWR